jgi:hypothetical protein
MCGQYVAVDAHRHHGAWIPHDRFALRLAKACASTGPDRGDPAHSTPACELRFAGPTLDPYGPRAD